MCEWGLYLRSGTQETCHEAKDLAVKGRVLDGCQHAVALNPHIHVVLALWHPTAAVVTWQGISGDRFVGKPATQVPDGQPGAAMGFGGANGSCANGNLIQNKLANVWTQPQMAASFIG